MDMNNDADTIPEQTFMEHMLKSTVNLVRLDHGLEPCGLGSGLLIHRNENVYLVSVNHGLKKGRFAIETNQNVNGKNLMIPLNSVVHMEPMRIEAGQFVKAGDELDFSWCRVDIDALKKQATIDGVLLDIELPFYTGSLTERPQLGVPYGYAAWNRAVSGGAYQKFLERSASCELYMEYIDVEQETGLYRFKLAREHQGRKYYEGASGAPIADPSGVIVALLVGGNTDEHFLRGFPLADYSPLIGIGDEGSTAQALTLVPY